MRAYSASSEEALHARNLLKDWAGEGFIDEGQYQRMAQDTACDLRSTNIFLRLVLFFFTLIIVGAAVALFCTIFLPRADAQSAGIALLLFAPVCYAAAEVTVSRLRLYRHGIEEALAACSVGFLCAGLYGVLPTRTEFLSLAACAIVSLWIWHRFGLAYAFIAAMTFVLWLPDSWNVSASTHRLIVTGFYVAGLITVAAVRSRYRFGYLNDRYQIVEAFLWMGIYLVINLELSSIPVAHWWGGRRTGVEFPRAFYWATWVLTWCLPPAILARGLRRRDRFVIAAGALGATLTLATNKSYLGLERHTWDPILLSALLIGVALFLRRWLAAGPDGIRHGFTAHRLSRKDEQYRAAASAAFGLVSPQAIKISPQRESSNVRFGGGDSGGGGASSDF